MNAENNILFSIGIPAFKSLFLEECVNSILAQTYARFELIIINDCSPEPIDEIVSKFQDDRITYLKNDKNTGAENVVDNWNKCLQHANGEFFVLMGDDDTMSVEYLEEFTKLINRYPNLDIYHCRSKIINESSEPYLLTPSWPEYETVYENIWHRINNLRIQFISDFVYRTSVLKANGGFYKLPLAWASDDVSSYIACSVKGIAHTNNPVFNYRRSRYTISSSGSNELKMKAVTLQHDWFNEFLKSIPANPVDRILHSDILRTLNKITKKKKIDTMSVSMQQSFLKGSSEWFNKRKKYNISFLDYTFSMVKALKYKAGQKMIHKGE